MGNNKAALIFPGTGCQYVGMGVEIYENYEAVRRTFEEANDVLGYDIADVCFHGSIVKLNRIKYLTPAILTTEVAMYRVLSEEAGIVPIAFAGHSMGEYTALCCAGAISFADALKIILRRAAIADEVAGGMTAINNFSTVLLEKTIASQNLNDVMISCYNSEMQNIISGSEDSLKIIERYCQREYAEVVPFIGSPPFHSSLMEDIKEPFIQELREYSWKKCITQVYKNVDALPYQEDDDIPSILGEHLCKSVLWCDVMKSLQNSGADKIIEVGPSNILKGLVSKDTSKVRVFSVDEKDDFNILMCQDQKKDFDTKQIYEKVIDLCLGVAVSIKNNADTMDSHKRYLKAYGEILGIKKKHIGLNTIQLEDGNQALKHLSDIFIYRNTPIQEQYQRINILSDKIGLLIEYDTDKHVFCIKNGKE